MVFGAVIDVPLIVGTFVIMLAFGRRLARALGRTRVPLILPYILISALLIVFEEDINCMPAWCGQVIIPPTLPFLMFEVMVLGLIATLLRTQSVPRLVLAYSVFGVAWEQTIGGLKGAPPLVDVIFIPYVALSYAFVSMLPLEVLLRSGRLPRSASAQQSVPSPEEPGGVRNR
ncbi:MAG TPA: hypothetical protein VKF15_08340 [Nitrososphaerales archaeon]|nr:hypothetical protein [Nitrososphaerales archaeon]